MWQVSDRVFGQRPTDGCWYPGTIRHIDGDRYYVIFDDGEDAFVPAAKLKIYELAVGDRVFCQPANRATYEPAQVVDFLAAKVQVRYDNGQMEWTTPASLRLQTSQPVAPQATLSKRRWAVGSHVLACFHDLFWYPGIVLAEADDFYQVLFDDGNQAHVAGSKIRPKDFQVGDRVQCRFKGGPQFYAGEIMRLDGEIIHINYDDGDEETTSTRLVRLDRDDWLPALDESNWQVGDRLFGCWFDQNWYPGVLVALNGKRVHVLFDDGDQAIITPDRIRPLKLKVGDRLFCRYQGGPAFYPGEVTEARGEVIHIQYDDGNEETTSIRFVRVEGENARLSRPEMF